MNCLPGCGGINKEIKNLISMLKVYEKLTELSKSSKKLGNEMMGRGDEIIFTTLFTNWRRTNFYVQHNIAP